MILPAGIDVTDPSIFENGIPHELFEKLLTEAPVWWNPQPPNVGGFPDDGFWVVSTHELVREVSRYDTIYSSWENTALVRFPDNAPRAQIESGRSILLNKDAPEHTWLRRIISRGFTPRAINTLRSALSARAETIVTSAAGQGRGNFVEQVACELPLQAIADLIGIPQDDRRKIFDWSNTMTGGDDPDIEDDPQVAAAEVMRYAHAMAAERRACPAQDIVTSLVRAQDEDGSLTDEEFGYFVILLIVAGSETTRNAITHGMMAFHDNPEQWETYRRERPQTAVDEILRWSSPVLSFQRTATQDTELGGQQIRKGDRVVMLYGSANYDEKVFDEPYRFDITRSPNPHLAFGGTGAHYCLGANLARMEVELVFDALAEHIPDISVVGPPVRLRSAWLNSIKGLDVEYRSCPVAH